MKRIIKSMTALLFTLCLTMLFGCSDSTPQTVEGLRIALMVSPSDVNDASFNQEYHEALTDVCALYGITYRYYRVPEETTDNYLSMIDAAVNDGFNTIICSSNTMARAVRLATAANPDVFFILGDCTVEQIGNNYTMPDNLTCYIFDETYAGYMAGYAAVKSGYRRLGFLGGIAVDAVKRYGYGYIQGIDCAAKELGVTDETEVQYVYGNQFIGDPDITAYMDNWYQNKGVEIVFSCGGAIWMSAASAAKRVNGKLIGVDSDQKEQIDAYTGQDTTLTSATKDIRAALYDVIKCLYNGDTEAYGGKFRALSLVSGDDPTLNMLQLPMNFKETDAFGEDDYRALVKKLYDGEYEMSSDVSAEPAVDVAVHYAGSIK